MTETRTGTGRSAGVDYQTLLDADTHPVRDILRAESPIEHGPIRVPAERYFSKAFHDLEVERLWKRVWQMACHEDDIPDVGDYHVYDIAELSFLIVRSSADELRAFHNACPHRGRLLRDTHGKWARELRCPFHGWSWNLEGALREIPCQWDFGTLDPADYGLSEVKLARWEGFVFINPDLEAAPFEDFVGDLADHFTLLPYERRYKEVHVAKILRCNWKVAQEAFSEAYHVVATHPTILGRLGDANSKYDVFGNYSRAISPNGTPSPHLGNAPLEDLPDARFYTKLRHPLSGAVYERLAEQKVRVTTRDGRSGTFRDDGTRIDGDLGQVDPNMCDWIGGRQLPGCEDLPSPRPRNALDDGARIGVMPRTGTSADVVWFDIEPCFIFHAMNAWDEGDSVGYDVCRMSEVWREAGDMRGENTDLTLHRYTFDLTTGNVKEETLDDREMEFPRVAPQRVGLKNRYAFTLAFGDSEDGEPPAMAGHYKIDHAAGTVDEHSAGKGRMPGEPVFVPAAGADPDSDEGYVMTFVYDQGTDKSEFVITDASNIAAPPIARVKLPRRVPFGFHGSWIPDAA